MILIDGETVWTLKATHGVPLDMILMRLARDGMVPTWDRLFAAAKKDGSKVQKLIDECKFYVKEAYEPADAEQINARLEALS